MQNENTRNTIVFVVLAAIIWVAYTIFILQPAEQRQRVERQRAAAAVASTVTGPATVPGVAAPSVYVDRAQALGAPAGRIRIDGPLVRGSISLRGGRLDDLYLTRYRETLDRGSPNVELLRPEGARFAQFTDFGWVGRNIVGLPNDDTVWRLASGTRLTARTPVILTHDNGRGLVFTRRIAVDDRYMFTVADTVANRTGQAVTIAPYASVQRQGLPEGLGANQIIHEGGIAIVGRHFMTAKYPSWRERDEPLTRTDTGGWIGITDKYWATLLIPDQTQRMTGQFRVTNSGGRQIYDANYVGAERTLQPATQTTATTRLFAGAKSVDLLSAYRDQLNLHRFHDAVDWGFLWFLTRPLFGVLHFFQGLVDNFGVAILLLTLLVRAVFFPLANKSYESMTKMKKLAPDVEKLKGRFKDDPAKQQQEMMALYKRENVNPLTGCLPILLQIPVFYALYKVLFVTLEMRHAPFFGWIRDLSARDPTTIWNVFGAIPWNPATAPLIGGLLDGALHVGLLPLVYGFTMWLTTAMNPPAPDPIQQRIFQLFPIVFTFVLAGSPAGLLIYWTFSNLVTILQQYVIMRRFKVDNPIDDFLNRFRSKPAAG